MEPNKTLFQVTKSEAEKTNIIIKNVLVMLGNRIYIDKNGKKNRLLDPIKAEKTIKDQGDGTFIIRADNGDDYALRIIYQRITAIGKQSAISDFFREYEKYRRIIVAKDFNNKIADHVQRHRTQIFREHALLEDIISYRDQPKYELLSPTEMKQVKIEYNVTDYTTQKILRSDPVTKYFALKRGEIIRIIRPSPTAGEVVSYRIVQ